MACGISAYFPFSFCGSSVVVLEIEGKEGTNVVKIHLNPDDGPIFLQIVRQVKQKVAEGELSPGQEISSIRELADELQVNPHTVAKAYQMLEADGIVNKRNRSGTFVSANLGLRSLSGEKERLNSLIEIIDDLRREAKKVGARLQVVICMLCETWD